MRRVWRSRAEEPNGLFLNWQVLFFLRWLQYVRAFLVLKECIRLEPDNALVYLQAAKLCYENLDMVRVFTWKGAHRRRKHCTLAVVQWSQKFPPYRRPPFRAQDGQDLNSWRWSLPLPRNPVWWGSMHTISSYGGNRPTHTHPPAHKQTGSVTIHCTAASAQRNEVTQNNVHALL